MSNKSHVVSTSGETWVYLSCGTYPQKNDTLRIATECIRSPKKSRFLASRRGKRMCGGLTSHYTAPGLLYAKLLFNVPHSSTTIARFAILLQWNRGNPAVQLQNLSSAGPFNHIHTCSQSGNSDGMIKPNAYCCTLVYWAGSINHRSLFTAG